MVSLFELGQRHEKTKGKHYKRTEIDNIVDYNEDELQFIHAAIGKQIRIYKMDSTWEKVIDDLLDVNKYNELLFKSIQRRPQVIVALRNINEELDNDRLVR